MFSLLIPTSIIIQWSGPTIIILQLRRPLPHVLHYVRTVPMRVNYRSNIPLIIPTIIISLSYNYDKQRRRATHRQLWPLSYHLYPVIQSSTMIYGRLSLAQLILRSKEN